MQGWHLEPSIVGCCYSVLLFDGFIFLGMALTRHDWEEGPLQSNIFRHDWEEGGNAGEKEQTEQPIDIADAYRPLDTEWASEVDAKSVYKSYVALQRYQDACYQDDAESKVFDVTGKRHLEISAYASIYSSSEKFLGDSKERNEYFHQPEVKCEMGFLLNKIYEENLQQGLQA